MAVIRNAKATGRGRIARTPAILGLVVLAAVTVVLVAVALVPVGTPSTAGEAPGSPLVDGEATPTASPTASESPTASVSPAESGTVVVPGRVLAALDADTAWRSSTGACPNVPAEPERTTDGGASFRAFEAGASAILAIYPATEDEVTLIAQTAECAPTALGTFVAGEQWAVYDERLANNWYLLPADPASIHSQAGLVTAPCARAVQLASKNETEAAVLCDDATFFVTVDAGATWSDPVIVAGAAAVSATTAGYAVAVADASVCQGVHLVALAGSDRSSPTPCLVAATQPGEIALAAASDGTLWIWAGATLARSNDGGATWR
ncbi:hypothetical protein [Luethyella okanaganae]|uniref:Uncharacterized protein n=1 Tax=Luethyella okanaganae TaxID=69372 RepID=A0ABW1VB55_9MICO